jgi:hypothetical protein
MFFVQPLDVRVRVKTRRCGHVREQGIEDANVETIGRQEEVSRVCEIREGRGVDVRREEKTRARVEEESGQVERRREKREEEEEKEFE